MIVVEHNKVELDYCTNCFGVWFDAGELELLLNSLGMDSQSPFFTDILNSIEAGLVEKKRKCPVCSQKMKKRTIGEQPEIIIDVCPRGHGLWLDGGEVASMVKQIADKMPLKQDSQQQVMSFLGGVFKSQQ
jgi:Zn-finger nucleic acid-binding protein